MYEIAGRAYFWVSLYWDRHDCAETAQEAISYKFLPPPNFYIFSLKNGLYNMSCNSNSIIRNISIKMVLRWWKLSSFKLGIFYRFFISYNEVWIFILVVIVINFRKIGLWYAKKPVWLEKKNISRYFYKINKFSWVFSFNCVPA